MAAKNSNSRYKVTSVTPNGEVHHFANFDNYADIEKAAKEFLASFPNKIMVVYEKKSIIRVKPVDIIEEEVKYE